MERLLGLHALGGVGLLVAFVGGALGLEVPDQALERVLAPVQDEVVGELALELGNLGVGRDVVRVDHREVEAGVDAVVQEHAVDRRSRRDADAEADVRDAERGLDAGDLGLDPANPLDRLDRGGLPFIVARGQRERQAVEDQCLVVEPVLVAAELHESLRDLDLTLGGLGHSDLVDRQRDQRGAVRLGDRNDAVELGAPGLEVDRVDDRPPGDLLQRGLDHVGLGRIDLDRRGLGERDPLRQEPHLLAFVLALGQCHAQVEHVRAAGHLVLGDRHEPVVVVAQQ